MDRLPQTKGKGVLMFAQRRKRMDEIAAEHEEMRRKGIPVEGVLDSMPDITKSFPTEESYNSQAYMDTNAKQDKENLQQPQYQEQQQLYQQQQYQQQAYLQSTNAMNGVDIMSKALVSNRTAKPFLGGQNKVPAPFLAIHSVSSPTPKKPENIFKVPVPVNTSPHVWSPTGDIIASRDERIAVPAIKTGILPDSKRRGVKTPSSTNEALKGDRNPQLESKGDRRSFIESGPEEDYLSLGAEACNFMQAPRVKHKIPPPVAPKPTINPSCPPWSAGSSSQNQAPRSPMPVSSPSPAGIPKKVPPQQPWVSGPQPAPETWTPSQPLTQKRPQLSSQPPWISEQQRVPVSMPARAQPKTPWMKPHTDASSVASCPPPQRGSSYFHAPKVPSPSFRGNASDASMCPSSDGPKFKGKGAELFARRHARMERFVVDDETVQANKSKSNSPTPSLPSTWKLSSNIRAPPPTSYNPILSPSYPPGAVKQPPATSPKIKSKAKNDKPKTAPKHLNTLDVMKHQPYQLDSSLFMYNASPEGMGPSPKASPVPPPESTIQGFAYPHSPMYSPSQLPVKPSSPVKSNPPVLGRSRSLCLPQRSMSTISNSSLVSPTVNSSRTPLERHTSWVEKPTKSPYPWEAAAKSPLGLVDDVFTFQKLPQTIASRVTSAAHRRSLPEPPLEWKQRVSFEPAGCSPPPAPSQSIKSPTKTSPSSPDKPVFYGPPFRPAQPLTGNTMFLGAGSLLRKPCRSNTLAPLNVSCRM